MKKSKKKKIEDLTEEEMKYYQGIYRKFKTQQYTLVHKGYAVYNNSFEEFFDMFNEETNRRERLTPKERRKIKISVLDTVVNDSKIYTYKMAKLMAKEEGITVSEWKRKTINEVYSGTFLKPDTIDETEAVKVRQSVFELYLQKTGDYDIAHAEYMTIA